MPAETPSKTFREAAAVVLVRGHGERLEAFWVQRGDALSVMPGFRAFPGGKADAEDAELAIDGAGDGSARYGSRRTAASYPTRRPDR